MIRGWIEGYPEEKMDAVSAAEYWLLRRLIEREGRLPAVWWRPMSGTRSLTSTSARPEAVRLTVDGTRADLHVQFEYDYEDRSVGNVRFRDYSAYLRWARKRVPHRLALSWYLDPLMSLTAMVAEAFDPRMPYCDRHPDLCSEVRNIGTLRSLL